eukprot:CAMPEP_0172084698 /NCGR_PEP_ID=MMETSP1043-20130122/21137_1 /TAXON_ID=464988 /ORGANISM="Hemiselmis andersenii, Strain CCMP441" /LENGTH=196 /DNA_ID=CAMNT_0012746549 /DNA_START=41 /DNA_END=627 /DNA_ORIENTATION=+
MEEAALEELDAAVQAFEEQSLDWKTRLGTCQQVSTQLSSMHEKPSHLVTPLFKKTISCLLLAQGSEEVATRLLAEEILQSLVVSVPPSSPVQLIDLFHEAASVLPPPRSKCLALEWLCSLSLSTLKPTKCVTFVPERLHPVLLTVAEMEEDEAQVSLDSCLNALFPDYLRFLDSHHVQDLQQALLPKLLSGSDARV